MFWYDPDVYGHATAAYPWLTELIGTGPFVWGGINVGMGRGDLIAYDTSTHTTVMPDCHYWKTNDEIHDELVEMFWELGDVNLDGEITVIPDMAIMSHWFMTPVPPAPESADLNGDGTIDMRDLTIAAVNYGEEREIDP